MLLESLKPNATAHLKAQMDCELKTIYREMSQYEAVLAASPDPTQRLSLEKLLRQLRRRATLLTSRRELYESALYQEGDSAIFARTLLVA